jgi:hypothetical protein
MTERVCQWCGKAFGRAVYGGKQECRRSFEKRLYCCKACCLASANKRSRDHYAANRVAIRARKSEVMRELRTANPPKYRAQSRQAKAKLREQLFQIYGAACALCGFTDRRALTLDHILKNGAKERAELGERGVYRRALVAEFRSEYRTLCMNCQFIARHPVAARAWQELA